jgi:transposase-like protein
MMAERGLKLDHSTIACWVLQSAALQVYARRPRVINVDGHPAYPGPIEELKRSGELGRNCRCRRASYLNNILEQDHRFVKKRMISSQWFRSVDGALRIIAGYKAVNIVRKGQIRRLPKAESFSAENCALVYQYPIDSFVQQRATRWTLASQLIIRIYL